MCSGYQLSEKSVRIMQRLVPLHSILVRGTLGTELRSEFTELPTGQVVSRTIGKTSIFYSGFWRY